MRFHRHIVVRSATSKVIYHHQRKTHGVRDGSIYHDLENQSDLMSCWHDISNKLACNLKISI